MADCNCQGFCWCKLCFYSNHLGSIYNPSKIYIQFTIFNIYFSTKLLFTKQEISLACARKVSVRATRSQIYYIFLQFIHPLSLHSRGNATSFAFMLYIIVWVKFSEATFLNNFYFYSFFYHLCICQHQRKIWLLPLRKGYLYKFFF